jgi:geranylgeranyl diphosphate synthase type II
MNHLSLADYCDARRATIDAALERCLTAPTDCPARLLDALRYAVFPGGKRLRPLLVLMAAAAAGGDETEALPPACAVELIHCYSLVHDDLPGMDNDDLRRGRPTVHRAYDEAIAILVGDGLLTLAFEVLAADPAAGDRIAAWTRELARAAGVAGMVGGQADDMVPFNPAAPREQLVERLQSIHARKTGALIRASVRLGAIAARSTPEQSGRLDGYGRCVGLAFQIVDDLLDVRGDEAKMGKRLRKDDPQGKLTFPGLIGSDAALAWARRLAGEACDAIDPLRPAADRLAELARFIVERDS